MSDRWKNMVSPQKYCFEFFWLYDLYILIKSEVIDVWISVQDDL